MTILRKIMKNTKLDKIKNHEIRKKRNIHTIGDWVIKRTE